MNKYLIALFSFILGMMILLPFFSYQKAESEKYSVLIENNTYPRHPVHECLKDKECLYLAQGAYYEARGESNAGVVAVMQTILNRVNHNRWKDSIKGVLYEKGQFSYTFDGSMEKGKYNRKQWWRMLWIAYETKNGIIHIPDEWKEFTHYHEKSITPKWSKKFDLVATIQNHKFYKCEKWC